MARWTRRAVLGAGIAALTGCAVSATPRPRLDVLYGEARRARSQPPLVVVPGAFGSTLRDRTTGREAWPQSDSKLLFSNYRHLELPIDPRTLEPLPGGLEAHAVFREGLGRDFYGRAIDALQRVGYRRARAGQPPREGAPALYTYEYDFRFDNVHAVRGFSALLRQIREDHGDPALKVDVLAHSNGGLLARYYARYGEADMAETGPFEPTYVGVPHLRRVLLVGTPNLGTIQPVLSLLRGEEVGLRMIPPEVMATCPGVTQMLPHPAVPWLVDLTGRAVEASLYDIGTWRDFQLNVFDPGVAARTVAQHGGGAAGERYLAVLRAYLERHLARGRRFAESLSTPASPDDLRPRVFGGDCELTLARLVAESAGGRLRVRERVRDIASPRPRTDYEAVMFEPGDTVVTRSSLLVRRSVDVSLPREPFESLQVAHGTFLCERHQQLTGNASFLDNMLHALFSADVS
jgi:hypothetical protein